MDPRRYTTREVARLLDLPERRIRSYVRAGVITGGREDVCPRGRGTGQRLRFDFRDILVLRTARKLLGAGLATSRVRIALLALRAQLPAEQPLSGVRIAVEGGHVIVSDGHVRWEPESGQGRLAFDPIAAPGSSTADREHRQPSLAEIVRTKKRKVAIHRGRDQATMAGEWFKLGTDLESNNPDGAFEAYLQTLVCNPEHVEAMVNLGRLCCELGDSEHAAAYFRQAVRTDPANPVAHFNLAVTMHDAGDAPGATRHYEMALELDPEFADAHFNLAVLLEERGLHGAAQEHLEDYRRIVAEHSS